MAGFDAHISAGGYEAAVSTLGAALRSLRFEGREFLDSFERPEDNPDARGQTLIPFPNRIEDGRYVFRGEEHRLPIDEPERGHAIHGLARWSGWSVSEKTGNSVNLRYDLAPQPGYPFPLAIEVRYELSPSGLAVATTATNTGDAPLPFGVGHHPYFIVEGSADDAFLRVPADTTLELDGRLIPTTGRVPVEEGDLDFREGGGIRARKINACFTGLDFDDDGRATVSLSDGGRGVEIWMGKEYPHVQIYTADEVSEEHRRRKSVAVEPMTCAPNAFNSDDGLRVLRPGESFVGEWGIKTTP